MLRKLNKNPWGRTEVLQSGFGERQMKSQVKVNYREGMEFTFAHRPTLPVVQQQQASVSGMV